MNCLSCKFRCVVICMLAFGSYRSDAASIQWGNFATPQKMGWADWSSWGGPNDVWEFNEIASRFDATAEYGNNWKLLFHIAVNFETSFVQDGAAIRLMASEYGNSPIQLEANNLNLVNIVAAQPGQLMDDTNTRGNDNRYFLATCPEISNAPRRDYDVIIPLDGDRTFYLGFGIEGEGAEHVYGWLKGTTNENKELYVIGYAFDLDGDPIKVGAIPEPHSGLLLLVGGALLALRRRRWDTRFQFLARIRSEQVRSCHLI